MDEDRLRKLRDLLNSQHDWPSIYVFKFVLPSDAAKITQLRKIFGESAEFRTRLSRQGNYTSITVREMMLDADSIFDRYTRVSSIGGVISL
jgi:hypothetical protein